MNIKNNCNLSQFQFSNIPPQRKMCLFPINRILRILLIVTILILSSVVSRPNRSNKIQVTKISSIVTTEAPHLDLLEESDELEVDNYIIITSPLVCGDNERRGANGRCRSRNRFL